jgi:chain length determinant protein tyrosine kinase EpsG
MQNSNEEFSGSVSGVSIGALLMQLGKIDKSDNEKILRAQGELGLRFGDSAIALGLITEADISQALALQFQYPYLQPGEGGFSDELVAAYHPFSRKVEALRGLRSQLMTEWFSKGFKALAVVGANRGDGVSYLTANLAIVFSQLGQRTLLIDANLRHPRQNHVFALSQKQGLSDILVGRADLSLITQIDAFNALSVLGAGTIPPNPQELLDSSAFTTLMLDVIGQYDVVLVDAPPASISADAQAVVARCGGALVVSRLNHTRLEDLDKVREQINLTLSKVVAAVVSEF